MHVRKKGPRRSMHRAKKERGFFGVKRISARKKGAEAEKWEVARG